MDLVTYIKGLIGTISGKNNETDYGGSLNEISDYINDLKNPELPDLSKDAIPDGVTYERLEQEKPDKEEIEASAKAQLADYENKGLKGIDENIEAERTQLDKNKESAEKAALEAAADLESTYSKAKESVSNDLLKRGLARSSIAAEKVSGLESEKADKLSGLSSEVADKLSEIETNLAALETKRTQAINDFNIGLAAKTAEKIGELTAEREKLYADALKYNNALSEKEQSYAANKAALEADLRGKELSNLSKELSIKGQLKPSDGEVYRKTYDKLNELLSKMDPADAREAVKSDPYFKDNLSEYYYYKLYDTFVR